MRERRDRYDEAGLLGKAAMHLTRAALSPEEREVLRRRDVGVEGRVAEDVIRAVRGCDAIWALLAEKDLPEDVSGPELDSLLDSLVGRPARHADNVVSVSIRFADRPLQVAALRDVIPGDLSPHEMNAYRYATLTAGVRGGSEPFIVALREHDRGANEVVAVMPVAASFLRHEQEFGVVSAHDLDVLEDILRVDLLDVTETHEALLDA